MSMQMGANRQNIARKGALQRKRRNTSVMYQLSLIINKEADAAQAARQRQREEMFSSPSELFNSTVVTKKPACRHIHKSSAKVS